MKALFKNTFSDVSLLYKNFFHWNVSKLIIFIYSFILSFIVVLPLVLILFIYGFFTGGDLLQIFQQLLTKTIGGDSFINIMLYIIPLLFGIVYLYGYVLLIKLNLTYLEGEKLKYFKNYYLNISKILKYLGISFINFGILLIPIIIFLLLNIGVVFIFYGGINEAITVLNSSLISFISIFSLVSLIITIIILIYLLYRIYFSYFIFIEDEEKNSSFHYIKKSFKKTNSLKTFVKFIPMFLVFLIIAFPTHFILKLNEKKIYDVGYYSSYNALTEEQKQEVSKYNGVYLQYLELNYANLDSNKLKSLTIKTNIYIYLIKLFNFMFLYGLFQMVLTSFYIRKIK